MEFSWKPNGVLDDDGNDLGELFKGEIVIEVKSQVDRLELANQLNAVKKGNEVDAVSDNIERLKRIMDIAKNCVKKVDMKAIYGEMEFNLVSLEDIQSFQEGQTIVNSILDVCINGFRLGKTSKPKSKKQ